MKLANLKFESLAIWIPIKEFESLEMEQRKKLFRILNDTRQGNLNIARWVVFYHPEIEDVAESIEARFNISSRGYHHTQKYLKEVAA